MVRMVTKQDRINHPEFDRMGISENMYFDFDEKKPHNQFADPDYDISEYTPIDYGNFLPKPKDQKKWVKWVNKLFVINLAKRKDRMLQAVQQLNRYSIPFERIEAIEDEKGAEGLRMTMEKLFKDCIKKKYEAICVFEDDLDIIEPKINEVMGKIMNDLPPNFDIIYLGAQLCAVPESTNYKHLLKVNHAFATHAAIYSLKAMKAFIAGKPEAPVDNYIVRHIQARGNTYCTIPFLVSQIVTHSDIYSDTPELDWKPYLEIKFEQMIKQMKR